VHTVKLPRRVNPILGRNLASRRTTDSCVTQSRITWSFTESLSSHQSPGA